MGYPVDRPKEPVFRCNNQSAHWELRDCSNKDVTTKGFLLPCSLLDDEVAAVVVSSSSSESDSSNVVEDDFVVVDDGLDMAKAKTLAFLFDLMFRWLLLLYAYIHRCQDCQMGSITCRYVMMVGKNMCQ